MPDFTSEDPFLDFFGSFWNRFFPDTEAIRGLAAGEAHQVAQLYQDFVEAVNAVSLEKISPFHRELVYPIVLRKSSFSTGPDLLNFDTGVVFGAQPPGTEFREGVVFVYGGLEQRSGLYYIGIPEKIKNLGRSIINSLVDPSVMLVRDSDFILESDTVVFKDDPFANPLIPRRIVAAPDGGLEEEIVLWATNVDFDRGDLYRQFGFAVSAVKPSSDNYKEVLRAVFTAYAGGPTRDILDALVATIGGLPVTKYASETVVEITTFGSDSLVITDAKVYKVDRSLQLRPEIVAGATLRAGQPLTTATQLFDRTSKINWWNEIPGLIIGQDFLVADLKAGLGFMNQETQVILGDVEPSETGVSGRQAKFYLGGLPGDVAKFWEFVRVRSVQSGQFLGNLLYRSRGRITNGEVDFSDDLYINPLQFLTQDLLGDSVVLIRVRASDFGENNPFTTNLRMLRDIMPAYLAVIIFVDVDLDDTYGFQRDQGGVDEVQVDLVDTAALIRSQVSGFTSNVQNFWTAVDNAGEPLTKTPEALSCDYSPDILGATLDLGDATANVPAYGGALTVCDEFVQLKLEEICEP